MPVHVEFPHKLLTGSNRCVRHRIRKACIQKTQFDVRPFRLQLIDGDDELLNALMRQKEAMTSDDWGLVLYQLSRSGTAPRTARAMGKQGDVFHKTHLFEQIDVGML